MCVKTSVSVIIPTYNSQSTIYRALSSVLSQTLQPIEIVVIDDGSVDNTISVVKEFSHQLRPDFLKLVKLDSNHGPAYARNVGWDMASGEFLAFLDADDSWHPRKLEIQANYMAGHTELSLTGHRCVRLSEGVKPPIIPQNWIAKSISGWQLMISYQFFTPSVMLRTAIPYRFDSSKRCCEDRMLFLHVALNRHKIARLELPLAYIYKAPYGEGGLSSQLWETEKSELENFRQLRQMVLLNRWQEILLKVWSLLKYMRRVWVCRRR